MLVGKSSGANTCLPHRFPVGPEEYLADLYFPATEGVVLAGDLTHAPELRARYGANLRIAACAPRVVLAAIERRFRETFRHRAVSDLAEAEPQFSAATVVTPGQLKVFRIFLTAVLLMLCAVPRFSEIALTVLFAVVFTANAVFRAVLLWVGEAGHEPAFEASVVPDERLPVYSILVPLYREANVMPALVRSLRALDYPRDRLDIKLIVECDDDETAVVADVIAALHPCFSVIRVPPGMPRTKPRACNYAMPFALGEFTVIFDAEDRPEPDQLRKAVAAFRAMPDSVACLQARLNFFNANENWLTRVLS